MLNPATEAVADGQLNADSFVLAGLARLAGSCDTLDEGVSDRLRNIAAARIEGRKSVLAAFQDYLRRPAEADAALVEVALQFKLDTVEILAVRLAIAAEQDLLIGHLLSHLQQPLALSRPTIGLIAQAYAPGDVHHAVHILGQGNAFRCGLLQLCGQLSGEDRPLAGAAAAHPTAHGPCAAEYAKLLAWDRADYFRSIPCPFRQNGRLARRRIGQAFPRIGHRWSRTNHS